MGTVIVSTPSGAGEAEPPSQEHSSVSKLPDFITSVKRSRHSARNSDAWIRLIQLVFLNKQATDILLFE